ncbi:MAG: hypothetical protein JGK01_18230 [Microcoleus sp. PH2017_03_ELD_O_A]|nr:hypothetical protein [Microcoleus sp. PH2017_04_SCI_O_A]MCC3443664.1 hypothetical protein [Microcoleus sp. PH2017_03_ELD_O_A]MCC3508214.1 hypothetical protein [Microcoleus sp. PH2017_17_BER_D_A]
MECVDSDKKDKKLEGLISLLLLTTLNSQLTTDNRQLSTVNCQLSTD